MIQLTSIKKGEKLAYEIYQLTKKDDSIEPMDRFIALVTVAIKYLDILKNEKEEILDFINVIRDIMVRKLEDEIETQ